jgi:Protein of unknown function (DUF3619)
MTPIPTSATNSVRAQDNYARRLVHQLDQSADQLPHAVLERLRAARVRAVASRKSHVPQTAQSFQQMGSSLAITPNDGSSSWSKLISFLPLLALVLGLIGIHELQNDRYAHELASIDQALLLDELPPDAYTDPGFLKFLSLPNPQNADNR